MSYYGWAPYVSVAERRAKAQKQLEKMKKKGLKVQSVQPPGRKIADSFWGKGWCDHIGMMPRTMSVLRKAWKKSHP